jgi:bacteriocin-like protein
MLINDLAVSKELNTEEMATVVGGTGIPMAPLLNLSSFFAPSNQFATQTSMSSAFTGPQGNMTYQGDNDMVMADAGAQALNLGGNSSSSLNSASATAVSSTTIIQS